jgi:hypothetical protein
MKFISNFDYVVDGKPISLNTDTNVVDDVSFIYLLNCLN